MIFTHALPLSKVCCTRWLLIVEGVMPAADKTIYVIYFPITDGYTIIEDYDTPLAAGNSSINVGECYE